MNYKTSLIALLLLIAVQANAQNFEGKVIFKNSYKSKIPNVTDEQFTAMMGTSQEYLIKGGDYKMKTNGTLFQYQLYVNADNKLYNKMANSEKLLWNDGAINPDEVIKAEVNKNATTILGNSCDELVLTCKSGVQKYYYSSKYKIDAKLYEKHKFGNWHEFLSRANAVPLKIVVDNPQFVIESIATEIIPMKLDSKEFELPAGAQTEKSPY
jgi:hypothetical protein